MGVTPTPDAVILRIGEDHASLWRKTSRFFGPAQEKPPSRVGKENPSPQYKHDAQASGLNSKPNTASKTKKMGGTDTCPQTAWPPMKFCSDKCRCRLRQEAIQLSTQVALQMIHQSSNGEQNSNANQQPFPQVQQLPDSCACIPTSLLPSFESIN